MMVNKSKILEDKKMRKLFVSTLLYSSFLTFLSFYPQAGHACDGDSADYHFLELNQTQSIAEVIAAAHDLKKVRISNVNWWKGSTPLWEERNEYRSYVALGKFIEILSKNSTLENVFFVCFPSLNQAQ